jgi:hypothetical protein
MVVGRAGGETHDLFLPVPTLLGMSRNMVIHGLFRTVEAHAANVGRRPGKTISNPAIKPALHLLCQSFNITLPMWQKFKEQLPAVIVTVVLIGLVLGSYASYVHNTVIPEMNAQRERDLAALREQHTKELKDAAENTRSQIAAVNKLLTDAIQKREADVFRTEEEVQKLNGERMDALAEAIAKKVQPFNPLPKTPEEAERVQNEQVDKVSTRLNEKIQPILAAMAGDQHLTRDSINAYSQKISDQISVVLTSELAKNTQLNNNLQGTQAIARDSLALSHELTALYVSSFKDQGVITRILTLPANVLKDASSLSILNSSEKKKKEQELIAKLAEIQKRLDDMQAQNPTK